MRHIVITVLLMLSFLPALSAQQSSLARQAAINIPVNWEVMKSGFSSSAAASASETYVEQWVYRQAEIDGASLQSPRAKVRVVALGSQQNAPHLPQSIAIRPRNLAKLLGLKVSSQSQSDLPTFIDVSKDASDSYELTFQSMDGEVLSVLISLWR